MARRFAREARLANHVDHPKVVRVVDAGIADDGAPFLVSELLDGETFEARARAAGGKLPLREVVRCADELLDVLAAAHARGVVHRDVKPGNLFRLASGELRVLDFGLAHAEAQAEEGESQLTGASTILGTAGFMAPELALGRWDLVDAQSEARSLRVRPKDAYRPRRDGDRGARNFASRRGAEYGGPLAAGSRAFRNCSRRRDWGRRDRVDEPLRSRRSGRERRRSVRARGPPRKALLVAPVVFAPSGVDDERSREDAL